MTPAVELRPSWFFACNECEDFEGGDWITKPERVTCGFCGAGYEVEE